MTRMASKALKELLNEMENIDIKLRELLFQSIAICIRDSTDDTINMLLLSINSELYSFFNWDMDYIYDTIKKYAPVSIRRNKAIFNPLSNKQILDIEKLHSQILNRSIFNQDEFKYSRYEPTKRQHVDTFLKQLLKIKDDYNDKYGPLGVPQDSRYKKYKMRTKRK